MPTALKSWTELTDLEKREAISKLLGRPVGKAIFTVDWPTNDGLAFAEVMPKLWALHHDIVLEIPGLRADDYTEKSVTLLSDDNDNHFFISDTWADAICRAAYELLQEGST